MGNWGYNPCNFRGIHSLKLTARTSENRTGPNRKGSYSNHSFSGAKMLVSGRVTVNWAVRSLVMSLHELPKHGHFPDHKWSEQSCN